MPSINRPMDHRLAHISLRIKNRMLDKSLTEGLGIKSTNPDAYAHEIAMGGRMNKPSDASDVLKLDDWYSNNITMPKHEFAVSSSTRLKNIVNNTRNYNYEKYIEDIEKYNQVFRTRSKPKNDSASVSRLKPECFVYTLTDVENDYNLALEDNAEHPRLKQLRDDVLAEVAMNKTSRLVAKSRHRLSRSIDRSLVAAVANQGIDPSSYFKSIDNVCSIFMIEKLVASFTTLADKFSIEELHRRSRDAAGLLKRHLEMEFNKETVESYSKNHYEDISRCEISMKNLIDIKNKLVQTIENYTSSINTQNIKRDTAKSAIVDVEKTKMYENIIYKQNRASNLSLSTMGAIEMTPTVNNKTKLRKNMKQIPVGYFKCRY